MTMNVYSLADRIIQRTDELKSQRMNFERLWQEVSELVLPRKADFTAVQAQGAKRGRKLFETTAVNAAELLAAGLHGLMTNPAGKWFSLTVTESAKTPEIDKWLIEAEQIIVDETVRVPVFQPISMKSIWIWRFWERPVCTSVGTKKTILYYFSRVFWANCF